MKKKKTKNKLELHYQLYTEALFYVFILPNTIFFTYSSAHCMQAATTSSFQMLHQHKFPGHEVFLFLPWLPKNWNMDYEDGYFSHKQATPRNVKYRQK